MNKTNLLIDLAQRAVGGTGRPLRAVAQDIFEIRLVLHNALIPVVTVVGLIVGQLLSGAVLTETIFSWPGIGKWIIDAITNRDYPVLQGAVLIIATIIIVVNLTIDLLYGVVNPRIRHQ